MKQVGPNFYKNQENLENRVFNFNKGEETLEDRIQKTIPKIDDLKKAATLWTMASELMKEGRNSTELKQLDGPELEKLCDPCDPAVIIAIIQYLEVNKNKLETLN